MSSDTTAESNRAFRVLLTSRLNDLMQETDHARKEGRQEKVRELSARMKEVRYLRTYSPRNEEFFVEIEVDEKPDVTKAVSFLDEAISRVYYVLHKKEFLKPGEQWTISLGEGCGFKGEVRIRTEHMCVHALKDIKPEHV